MDADEVEIRVLGSLIEKQKTTPDVYPLTLNALRLACNQATSREPVVRYEEAEIRDAVQRLSHRGWVRLASGPGSRVAKYRHLLDEALSLVPAEVALLAVLMLRGPQTAGELRTRAERLRPFASVGEVEQTLEQLAVRELVERRPRRPGEREERWAQLLGGQAGGEAAGLPAAAPALPVAAPAGETELAARVAALEQAVAELQRRFDER